MEVVERTFWKEGKEMISSEVESEPMYMYLKEDLGRIKYTTQQEMTR